jgi:hypothetical protein
VFLCKLLAPSVVPGQVYSQWCYICTARLRKHDLEHCAKCKPFFQSYYQQVVVSRVDTLPLNDNLSIHSSKHKRERINTSLLSLSRNTFMVPLAQYVPHVLHAHFKRIRRQVCNSISKSSREMYTSIIKSVETFQRFMCSLS